MTSQERFDTSELQFLCQKREGIFKKKSIDTKVGRQDQLLDTISNFKMINKILPMTSFVF